jgi:hypothetical protein
MEALRRELTEDELANAVAYVAAQPVPADARFEVPLLAIDAPWEAYIAFVDRQPLANWAHSARYILLNPITGESRSFEARFPPFGPEARERWLLLHRATSVPDGVIHHGGGSLH